MLPEQKDLKDKDNPVWLADEKQTRLYAAIMWSICILRFHLAGAQQDDGHLESWATQRGDSISQDLLFIERNYILQRNNMSGVFLFSGSFILQTSNCTPLLKDYRDRWVRKCLVSYFQVERYFP